MAIPIGKSKVIIRQGGQVAWEGKLEELSYVFPTCIPNRERTLTSFGANTGDHHISFNFSDALATWKMNERYVPFPKMLLEEESIPVEEDNVFAPRKVEVECAEVLA